MWPFSSDDDDEPQCSHDARGFFVTDEDTQLSRVVANRDRGEVFVYAGDLCTVFCLDCGREIYDNAVHRERVEKHYIQTDARVPVDSDEMGAVMVNSGANRMQFFAAPEEDEYDEDDLEHWTEEEERDGRYTSIEVDVDYYSPEGDS